MTDETKADAPKRHGGLRPILSVTPDIAFTILQRIEPKTLRELMRVLNADGHAVSLQTLSKWNKKYNWPNRLAEEKFASKAVNGVNRASILAETLVTDAKLYSADAITGLNWALVERFKQTAPNLRIENPDEAEKVVVIMEKLLALSHTLRGVTIQNAAQAGNGDGTVLRLGNFKKPMNGANGHG